MSVTSSPIVLFNAEQQYPEEGELLDSITDDQISDWENTWKPELIEAKKRLKAKQISILQLPANLHWDWSRKTQVLKQGVLAYGGYSVVCNGVTQGMMLIISPQYSAISTQKGQHVVYIDYLEVAPWNRRDLLLAPKYNGVGTVLLRAAIQLSLNEGFKGRIGLHSLPGAESFYLRYGMTEVGRDSNKQNLMYYEMTPQQAQAFIKGEIV